MHTPSEVTTDAQPTAPAMRRPLGAFAESELVSMAKAGDESAFGELLKKNYPSSLRLAFGMLQGGADAQDAVLQAFYKAYARLHQFEERSKFSSWISKIVVNECLSLRRRASWAGHMPIENLYGGSDGRHATRLSPRSPEEEVSRSQINRLVHQEIRRVPEILRRPLILWHLQERSMDDIVRELGVSHAAVKSRLTRGRAELRRGLSKHLPKRLDGF